MSTELSSYEGVMSCLMLQMNLESRAYLKVTWFCCCGLFGQVSEITIIQ